jgi:uncharacterized SAM-binding protein YcdF (DUF218 family)
LVLALVIPSFALYFARPFLCTEAGPVTGDALVVLGGEKTFRPPRALELFQTGAAPKILISGFGDCQEVCRYLTGKGVPAEAITLECESRNTKQNAEFSVRWLREHQVRRAVIVTSWFHSRRAVKCFRFAAPEIEFAAAPTIKDRPESHWPNRDERSWVLAEYLKLGYYWVRYGIPPF